MEKLLSAKMFVQVKPSYKLRLVCFVIRKVYNQIMTFYDILINHKILKGLTNSII